MTVDGGDDKGTTTVQVPLSDETRERLKEVAARADKREAEIAANLIEGAFAAAEPELDVAAGSALRRVMKAPRSSAIAGSSGGGA